MNEKDINEIQSSKQYLKSHKIEFILMGLGAIIGAFIGYYLWFIDFL